MIVPMHKITLLCMAERRATALKRLEELGVLHLTPVTDVKDTPDIESARRELQQAGKAISILSPYRSDINQTTATASSRHEIAQRCLQLANERKTLNEERGNLLQEITRCKPLGRFDPQTLLSLKEKGLNIKVFRMPLKEAEPFPPAVTAVILHEERGNQWVALISREEFEYNAAQFKLPERSTVKMDEDLRNTEKRMAQIEEEFTALARFTDSLRPLSSAAQHKLEMAEAHAGMNTTEDLAYLQGFCPEPYLSELRETARQAGWGLVVDAPEPKKEAVPTLVKYPRVVRPVKAVFDMLQILPGYNEADISAVFLIFFSIFFAMLIGDAGYGLLFLLATLFARRKFKKAPAYPFTLFTILSAATILWGIITGNYFGIPPESLPAFMRGIRIPWLLESENIMQLCFIIGAIHLTIAHLWNAAIYYPDKRWLAQIGWIGLVWTMFILASVVVLNLPLPRVLTATLFGGGIILVAAFMTPPAQLKQEWINHAMLPLNVVSCFVDVVSYIRLFAVGMASLQVARSFNDMAATVGMSHIIALPLSALILLLGHGLNIMLCGLGILVHGVRLNTLEFSLHKNLEWAGFPYKPFGAKE